MNCPAEETIALYAGGDLEFSTAATLEAHLAACADCAALARALESDGELLASPPPELAGIDFTALRRELVRRARRPRILPVVLAAAALLGAVAVGLVWRDLNLEVPPLPPVVAHLRTQPAPVPATPSRPKPRRVHTPVRRPAFPVPSNALRVPTKDPDVVIIWFAETKGDLQ